jgi:anti-sigma factor ChrR (cupin superfamily)
VTHARATDAERERAALYALGSLGADEARAFEQHLGEGCAVCRREVDAFTAVGAELGLAAAPVPPPADLRARVLVTARAEAAAPPPGFHFIFEGEGGWTPIATGVFRRDLVSGAAGATVYLIRMEPGSRFAAHRHAAVEDCYVVRGDLHVAGRHIHAGDHHRADAGTTHGETATDGGCLLLIAESAAA